MSSERKDTETQKTEKEVLARLLSTPPDPKPKKDAKANPPKKRGRPPKAKVNPSPSGGDA
jgi:hypothetical protein